MPNYELTKIYKLIENNDLEHPIYIGHTTEKYLSRRMTFHRSRFNRWKKGLKVYGKFSYFRDDLNINSINIVLIEEYPCKNIDEARAREVYYIELYQTQQAHPQILGIKFTEDRIGWKREYDKKRNEAKKTTKVQ